MSVKIEIYGEDGADAAWQMKQLGDTLALNALSQTLAAQQTKQISKSMADALTPAPKPRSEMTASEAIAEAQAAEQKAGEDVTQVKAPEPVAEPVDPPKKRKGRKSNAEKAAEATDVEVVEPAVETTDENPNPYRLFCENGAEEELFDTPAAFMTALASMFGDAPDSMTLKAVGKANEETVRRLQEESVDFSDLIKFFEKKKAEIETREATPATSQEPPAEPEKVEEAMSAEPDKVPTIDDVRAAIQSLASAKSVPHAIAFMKDKYKAAKATEIKEEDRAAFIAAAKVEVA
jgi:hypothetical protein